MKRTLLLTLLSSFLLCVLLVQCNHYYGWVKQKVDLPSETEVMLKKFDKIITEDFAIILSDGMYHKGTSLYTISDDNLTMVSVKKYSNPKKVEESCLNIDLEPTKILHSFELADGTEWTAEVWTFPKDFSEIQVGLPTVVLPVVKVVFHVNEQERIVFHFETFQRDNVISPIELAKNAESIDTVAESYEDAIASVVFVLSRTMFRDLIMNASL